LHITKFIRNFAAVNVCHENISAVCMVAVRNLEEMVVGLPHRWTSTDCKSLHDALMATECTVKLT